MPLSWAAKRGMVQTLTAMRVSGSVDFDASRQEIEAILGTLLTAAAEAGELRGDVAPADVRSLLAGILVAASDPSQAARLFDLAVDGLRAA